MHSPSFVFRSKSVWLGVSAQRVSEGAQEVEQLTELVNIFDTDAFEKEVEKTHGTASKADMIAHRTKRTLKEKWENDGPAFCKKFSALVEEA